MLLRRWARYVWVLIAALAVTPLHAQTVRYGRLTVNKAEYGSRGTKVDVTDKVRNLIRNNSLDFRVNSATLGGDPSLGADKVLRLTYAYEGAKHTIVIREGDRCHVP